jgi:hypothetical protein
MPLKSGKSKKTIAKNIKELEKTYQKKGKIGTSKPKNAKAAQKQAVAIAYAKAGKAKNESFDSIINGYLKDLIFECSTCGCGSPSEDSESDDIEFEEILPCGCRGECTCGHESKDYYDPYGRRGHYDKIEEDDETIGGGTLADHGESGINTNVSVPFKPMSTNVQQTGQSQVQASEEDDEHPDFEEILPCGCMGSCECCDEPEDNDDSKPYTDQYMKQYGTKNKLQGVEDTEETEVNYTQGYMQR